MASTLIHEDIVAKLKDSYFFDLDTDVLAMLQDRPDLVNTLSKLIAITASYFNNDQLYLTITKDPEHCSLDKLSVVVNTSLDTSVVSNKLSSLDEELLIHNIPNDIFVHVEFQ